MPSHADDGPTVVILPQDVYSLDAVKRASYALMAHYDVSITLRDRAIVCDLLPARPDIAMASAERDFRREVIDQDLRISIEQRTEPYRDLILGLAFSRTGLQHG